MMRLPWIKKGYDPIKVGETLLNAQDRQDRLEETLESGRYSERGIQRLLKSYLKEKENLKELGKVEEAAARVLSSISTLEMGEKILSEKFPEAVRRSLKQYTPEETAETNRRVEGYMDQWRKAQAPQLYGDSVDMRCLEIPTRRLAIVDGGYNLPESPQQAGLVLEKVLKYGKTHTPRANYNLN